MSSDPYHEPPNVEVRNLSKVYPNVVGAFRLARALFRGEDGRTPTGFRPALDGVSFDVQAGHTLGIIGLNGSGKSTLLQILAGVTKPTQGDVRVRAPLGALLELGAGFNPDCTGRENVITSAAIYGRRQRASDDLMQEVIAFADIGDFFDQPLRTYSNGMRARLAFALALQMRPRVLLVDEVLSVGDLSFQTKCYRHFEQLRSDGTSLIIVSHDLGAVRMLCDEAIALNRGVIQFRGDPITVTEAYTKSVQAQVRRRVFGAAAPVGQDPVFGRLEMLDDEDTVITTPRPGQPVVLRTVVRPPHAVEHPVANLVIRTLEGMIIYSYSTLQDHCDIAPLAGGCSTELRVHATLNLAPGPYTAAIGLSSAGADDVAVIGGTPELSFEVTGGQVEHGVAHLGATFVFEPSPITGTPRA